MAEKFRSAQNVTDVYFFCSAQVARGLDVVVPGVREHPLAAAGLPGSFLLRALAPCAVGGATGPRALVRE